MVWVLRSVAAFGVLLVLLGVGAALASGPVTARDPIAMAAPASAAAGDDPADAGASASAGLQPLPTGSASPPASTAPQDFEPVPYEERPVAVFLGDSITRGATVDTTWGDVTEWSWFYRLVDDSDGLLRYGGMVAENGMTTDWMAGQAYNALAMSPDVLVVHGGTNDISGEVEPSSVIANLQRIKDAADAVGVPLVVCTVPPRSDPAADARAIALNAAIITWGAEQSVPVLDTGAVLRNPDGGWMPGYSADGLHPTPEAAVLMARAAEEILRGIPLGV